MLHCLYKSTYNLHVHIYSYTHNFLVFISLYLVSCLSPHYIQEFRVVGFKERQTIGITIFSVEGWKYQRRKIVSFLLSFSLFFFYISSLSPFFSVPVPSPLFIPPQKKFRIYSKSIKWPMEIVLDVLKSLTSHCCQWELLRSWSY